MSGAGDVERAVREWVEKAEHDLVTAEQALKLRRRCPFDTVCFHAQQCAEKYLKALLVSRSTPFPKVHDIGELMALVPAEMRPPLDATEQERLALYAVACRYPGGCKQLARADAKGAVALAKRIRKTVRRHLKH